MNHKRYLWSQIWNPGMQKMCRKRKKSPISYKDKMRKTVKTSPEHNFKLGAQI
jgi:hypothetical protein